MLTQRLSLLFEFAPPDFYERSTFASYIDTLLETGLVREDADGSLHLHEPRARGNGMSSGCCRRTRSSLSGALPRAGKR